MTSWHPESIFPRLNEAMLAALEAEAAGSNSNVTGHCSWYSPMNPLVSPEAACASERKQQARLLLKEIPEVASEFTEAGIPKLSILTTVVWKYLARKSGLIGLQIDPQGQTPCSSKPFRGAEIKASKWRRVIVAFAWLVYVVTFLFFSFTLEIKSSSSFSRNEFIVFVVFILIAPALFHLYDSGFHRWLSWIIAKMGGTPFMREDWDWERTVAEFFPNGESAVGQYDALSIPLSFPDLPRRMQELIWQIRKLDWDVWLYVKPEAFKFAVTKEEILDIYRWDYAPKKYSTALPDSSFKPFLVARDPDRKIAVVVDGHESELIVFRGSV